MDKLRAPGNWEPLAVRGDYEHCCRLDDLKEIEQMNSIAWKFHASVQDSIRSVRCSIVQDRLPETLEQSRTTSSTIRLVEPYDHY